MDARKPYFNYIIQTWTHIFQVLGAPRFICVLVRMIKLKLGVYELQEGDGEEWMERKSGCVG